MGRHEHTSGNKLLARDSARHQMVTHILELLARVLVFIVFFLGEGEQAVPCMRVIRPEEIWLYKYPPTKSYVPTWALWLQVFTVGPLVFGFVFLIKKDKNDLYAACLSYSLATMLTGAVTNVLKLCAGRPRPDFYYRCFPEAQLEGAEEVPWTLPLHCTGDNATIIEGRKSFPSGHSSWSFSVMTWCFLYISGKLATFSSKGEGWRLCVSVVPLLLASCIAISRTCDNHHHWQDVLVGSLLGIVIAYTVYRRYYHSLNHKHCALPLSHTIESTQTIESYEYNSYDLDYHEKEVKVV